VVPSLAYVRLLAQDEKEKRAKGEEELKRKDRSFRKDFSSFIKYLK
jgi:hypothetical protein